MQYQIKAVGDWEIEILAVPFGSPSDRDSDGEFFTAKTKLHLDKFPTPPLVYYHGFEDKSRQALEPVYVGGTTKHEIRDDGVWFRGILNRANAMASKVWDAVKSGAAAASSGSINHLIRKSRTGEILEWPLAEISVFDTEGGKQPANKRAVVLLAMKSVYAQAGIDLPDDIEPTQAEPEAETEGATARGVDAAKSAEAATTTKTSSNGGFKMEPTTVQEMINTALKAQRDEAAAEQAKADAVKAQVDAALTAQKAQHEAEVQAIKDAAAVERRLPGGEAPYQTKFANVSRFDNLDAADLAVMAGVLGAAKSASRGAGPSSDLLKALAIQLAESKDDDAQYVASKRAMKMSGMPMKANEINQSTLANYGDEWVGITYSSQLWDKIRLATSIVGKIPTVVVPQGSESIYIPLQGTSPNFFKVAQAANLDADPGRPAETVPSSQLGTARQLLTVAKLGAQYNYSGELEEDSLIPWASELRRDLTAEAAEVMEHVVIDGDTTLTATTNINDIGGTPAGTEAFTLFNGFRKLALVTNTANSRSAGTLAVADFLETVKLMGLAGRNAADKSKVEFILDMWTHWAALELAEIKTRDVFVAPTLENGMLANLYGYNVNVSANMHRANQDATYGLKANTSGKVDLDTAANNTTGSILAVRYDQWRLGYKRKMTFEIERDARSDSTAIIVMMRVGMINRDNEASAISYGVTLP